MRYPIIPILARFNSIVNQAYIFPPINTSVACAQPELLLTGKGVEAVRRLYQG